MIPAEHVHPRAVEALQQYLTREIHQALSDRRPLERRWRIFEQAYKALPEVEVKEFPFLGAANLVIPVVATDVDTIFARIMGILFAPDSLWSTRALRPEMVDYAPRVKELLQWSQEAELGAYDAVADWVQDICILGTGILKQRYKRETKWAYQFREGAEGRQVQAVREMMVSDHPVLEHVSLYDALWPAVSNGVQEAPWFAERVQLTWEQYAERVRAGIYQHSERISRAHAQGKGSQIEQERARLDALEPGLGDKLTFWETWLDFDISATGRRFPLVVTMHLESQTPVRIDFNPFMNQEKPYSAARFLRQRGRFLGIGLAEMLTPVQDEVSAMHNQRIDAGTIANSPMFAARNGAGISENEPVWPGRWFILEDPQQDINPLQWGQQQPPDLNVANEQIAVDYYRRRTGVNDYVAGQTQPHTGYATATTSLNLLQEAARKIDQTLREIRNALGESGTRIMELYQQFNQQGKMYAVFGEEDGAMLNQFLQFPPELLRWSVGVEVTATSAALNKEVEIRTNMLVMELLNGFYDRMFQSMMLVIDPRLPPEMRTLAFQMARGGEIIMKRILDSHGVQDIERLVPDPRSVMNVGAQGNPGGAGVPAGPGPAAGMGGIPAVPQGANGAGSAQVGGGRLVA